MAASTATKKPAKSKERVKLSGMALHEQRWGRLFVASPFIGFCLFSAFPIVFAFVASLSNWTGTNSIFQNFIGLKNYTDLFTDMRFWKTMGTTVIYMIGIPVGMILGLLIAVAMNRKIPGVKILRTMYYVPVISSLVAVAILWAWVFNYDYGLFNTIIKAITGAKGPNWLGDEMWVKVAMIIFMVWKGLGTSIILYLSGLQNIPRDYYEAATIDGATGIQAFRHIIHPSGVPRDLLSADHRHHRRLPGVRRGHGHGGQRRHQLLGGHRGLLSVGQGVQEPADGLRLRHGLRPGHHHLYCDRHQLLRSE